MSDDEDAVAALLDELAEAPPDDALDAAAERLAEDALAAACAEELEDAAARVVRAAEEFGSTQAAAAASWVEEAIEAGESAAADGTELLAKQPWLLEKEGELGAKVRNSDAILAQFCAIL